MPEAQNRNAVVPSSPGLAASATLRYEFRGFPTARRLRPFLIRRGNDATVFAVE